MILEIITIPEQLRAGFGFGSYKACQSVAESLSINHDQVAITVCKNREDLCSVVARKPDLVVLAVKHIPLANGEEIWLSEFFEKAGIAYTGSKQITMMHDVNKEEAKKQMKLCDVKTADYLTSIPGEYTELGGLPIPYPLFLKPVAGADSLGINTNSLVQNFGEFEAKVLSLYERDSNPVLAEQYLSGREFTVAMIEDGDTLLVAAVEIIAPEENGIRILSEKVKAEDTETLQTVVDAKTLVKISTLARKSFKALGVRDFARIDIRMDENEECYFMEANLTPGMKKGSSYFPEAFNINLNLNYDAVMKLITKNALKRNLPRTSVL